MVRSLKYNLLPISVFTTGACVLIVEIVATRILSPYFGNTIFTVSSVISVILAALSLGYYQGGKIADQHPSLRWFFGIILVSGLAIITFYFIGKITLPILGNVLPITTGPLIFSLFLFFIPALLLGTLSPYAVKLQSVHFPEQGVGSVAGKIFFWSTLGSIAGSLLAGFALIPYFGIDRIVIGTGITLFLLGLVALLWLGIDKKNTYRILIMLVVLTGLAVTVIKQPQKNIVYSKDGVYEKITIYDGSYAGRPARFFQQDHSSSGAIFLDSNSQTDMVYDYTKYYFVYKIFKPDIQNALVIGGGAYSIPKALLAELPNANIDVSEIEPLLFDLAKKYFGASDNPRLHNYTEDGRRLLTDSNKKYDLIFSDAYYSLFSIPAHFTSQEFFTIAKSRLATNGIFVANLIGDLSRQQPSLTMAEIKTFQTVFPNSYFFTVTSPGQTEPQNIIIVGYNSTSKMSLDTLALTRNPDSIIRSLPTKIINIDRFDLSPYPILIDNFSPVEYLTSKVLERTFGQEPLLDGKEILAVIGQILGYGPRYLSAPGHTSVQNFLIAEMKQLAQDVRTQTWQHTAPDGKKYQLTNIITRFNPTQKKRIILATHYDSQKFAFDDQHNQSQSVPGANNSASGVAVLVELARALSNHNMAPAIGVDIVFFDGEEGEENQGGDFSSWQPLGSTYFAQHLNDLYTGSKPESALVLDMICKKNLKVFKEQSSVQKAPAQVAKLWDIGQKIDSKVFQNGTGQTIGDDHTPLNQAGVPSVLLIDLDYPQYATTGDTLDKCGADSLQTVAHATFDYILAQ